MTAPTLLADSRIAIIGLGLMGGSLAMALKGECAQIYGVDNDPATVVLAKEYLLTDSVALDPREILPHADVVILAAPVHEILSLIQALPTLHPGKAIVLDLGSTKSDIVMAMDQLPSRFDPLGGHPMCGKEALSLNNAEASLYEGAAFAFTPCAHTSKNARALANQIARAIGATPLWIDADTHDRWAAATSHLPYLIAATLALATPLECTPLVGPGYRSTTRLAATPASMMSDILATNRLNILASLEQYRDQLDEISALLQSNDMESLLSLMEDSANRRAGLVRDENEGGAI